MSNYSQILLDKSISTMVNYGWLGSSSTESDTTMKFGINWAGWHVNCGCPARKDAYRDEDITVDVDIKTAVADAVDANTIGVADKIIDDWVKTNVDSRATWKWARETNTVSFGPSGNASITRQQKIRRDAIMVTVAWCTTPMFAAVRPWGR